MVQYSRSAVKIIRPRPPCCQCACQYCWWMAAAMACSSLIGRTLWMYPCTRPYTSQYLSNSISNFLSFLSSLVISRKHNLCDHDDKHYQQNLETWRTSICISLWKTSREQFETEDFPHLVDLPDDPTAMRQWTLKCSRCVCVFCNSWIWNAQCNIMPADINCCVHEMMLLTKTCSHTESQFVGWNPCWCCSCKLNLYNWIILTVAMKAQVLGCFEELIVSSQCCVQ